MLQAVAQTNATTICKSEACFDGANGNIVSWVEEALIRAHLTCLAALKAGSLYGLIRGILKVSAARASRLSGRKAHRVLACLPLSAQCTFARQKGEATQPTRMFISCVSYAGQVSLLSANTQNAPAAINTSSRNYYWP